MCSDDVDGRWSAFTRDAAGAGVWGRPHKRGVGRRRDGWSVCAVVWARCPVVVQSFVWVLWWL